MNSSLTDFLTTARPEQVDIINKVVSSFWQTSEDQVTHHSDEIEVIKCTGLKIMGYLPAFFERPSAFFKIYFKDRNFYFELDGIQASQQMNEIVGITSLKPVWVSRELRAIITERKKWNDTESALTRFRLHTLEMDWEKIAEWLRAFHDTKVTHEANEYFINKKFQKIENHIKSLSDLFNSDQQTQMRLISDEAKLIMKDNTTLDWVVSHGDFGLDNLKISKSITYVIDFEDSQPAPREFDVTNFLTRFEYSSYFPNCKSTFSTIYKKFMQGYNFQFSHRKVSDFFYLLVKLDMLESYHRRRFNNQAPISQRMIYWYFEQQGLRRIKRWLEGIARTGT